MNFATLLTIYQFLVTIAPLVASIYDAVRLLFPDGTPGAVKMDTFRAMVRQLLATRDELKRFEPIFEEAWPLLQTMIEAFHHNAKSQPTSNPGSASQ